MNWNTERNRKRRAIIAGGVLLVAAVLLLLLRACSAKDAEIPMAPAASPGALEMDANSEEGGLVYRSQEEIQEELNRKVAEGMINISMNTSPVFPSGTEKGNLLIVNNGKGPVQVKAVSVNEAVCMTSNPDETGKGRRL